jgi:hypothetical protein
MALEKLKRHKSTNIDQILTELINAVGKTIHFEIRNLISSVWNKEELPEQWKLFIVPIYKKCDKRYLYNCQGILLLSTTCKILSNILLSRLTPYAGEIIGDHQCGFRRNSSTTDHIFCIHQILEKKWE